MRIEFWKSDSGKWYFQIVGRNGRTIAVSTAGTARRAILLKTVHSLAKSIGKAQIVEVKR